MFTIVLSKTEWFRYWKISSCWIAVVRPECSNRTRKVTCQGEASSSRRRHSYPESQGNHGDIILKKKSLSYDEKRRFPFLETCDSGDYFVGFTVGRTLRRGMSWYCHVSGGG